MQEVLSSTEDVGPAPSSTPEIATFIAAAQAAGARLALMQDDTDSAESRTWAALRFAPQDPQVWSLLGISLRKSGEFKAAEQAFAIAQTLAPAWAPELFEDRWRAALRAKDIAAIVILAEDYSLRYPESTLAAYYRAEALLATYQPLAAIEALIPSVQEPPSAPALLWYTLGRAYLARGGFREAATALEVAASKIAQGDSSLDLVVDDQILALSIHLGKAYFGMDRCAEAEGIFRRLSTDHPEFEGWLERSIICQTPTPTLTPWMPVMTPYP
jgi:predicted Zn-dependent protease